MKSIREDSEKIIYIGDDEYLVDPDDFKIDESNLDGQLGNIAYLLMSYGHIEARARLAMGNAEAGLEYCYAICYNEHKALADSLKEKATVDQLKNKTLVDSRYMDSVEYTNFTREQHARARWAVVALQQKSEALRTMAYRDNRMSKLQYE